MMRPVIRDWLFVTIKIAVGLMFIYTGTSKLGNLQSFADGVITFHFIPAMFANIVAMTLRLPEC